jgi:hypothetical protein
MVGSGSRIRDKHPRSATLKKTLFEFSQKKCKNEIINITQLRWSFHIRPSCAEQQNNQFWRKWAEYSLGPEVISLQIEWARNGGEGELHPSFFTIGNRQLRERIIGQYWYRVQINGISKRIIGQYWYSVQINGISKRIIGQYWYRVQINGISMRIIGQYWYSVQINGISKRIIHC